MFALKAQMAVMSHLSDAQEAMGMGDNELSLKHINFAKQLILQTEGSLNILFEEEELNKIWQEISE